MIDMMMADYATGNFTVAMIGMKYGISTGKAYQMLRDAGCKFSRKWRKPMSEESRKRISERMAGKTLPEEWRRSISEAKKCDYNGMNGYGHTKIHRSGYVLAYVPLHPHANMDGYVMLHTVVVEQHIGRYLAPDEVVHHVNHNRQDNRIENLALMKKKDHMSMHMKERHAKRRSDLLTAFS